MWRKVTAGSIRLAAHSRCRSERSCGASKVPSEPEAARCSTKGRQYDPSDLQSGFTQVFFHQPRHDPRHHEDSLRAGGKGRCFQLLSSSCRSPVLLQEVGFPSMLLRTLYTVSDRKACALPHCRQVCGVDDRGRWALGLRLQIRRVRLLPDDDWLPETDRGTEADGRQDLRASDYFLRGPKEHVSDIHGLRGSCFHGWKGAPGYLHDNHGRL
mmetsp:Transcript_85242/g.160557  ORF Transcript_85242/g.160557 Transcript_85242/m.160557 type:complete len:212 (-) Transcript_85242:934-1569(-)